MTDFPNLGGVITTDDISTKGSGSYAADYVNWAKIAHLLHVHAPGWQFALRQTSDGGHIWKAPDGSGYVVGYFACGELQSPDFPQACMDNRNNPIAAERITARTLTDTHRRCLCTAAAFTFGLGYELWARVEVENPMREDDAVSSVASASKPQPAKAKTIGGGASFRVPKLMPDEAAAIRSQVAELPADIRNTVVAAFVERFSVPQGQKAGDYITTAAHKEFLQAQIEAHVVSA